MSELVDEYDVLSVDVGNHVDRVATIAIDRPEARNAMNRQVRSELKDALIAAEEDDSIRVVVLTGGDGTGAFVAGADVSDFQDRDSLDQRKASERPRVYEIIDNLSLPVIARINGHALGGGCELAQACDVRIAQTDIKVGQPEINLGLIPGGGGTQRLPRLVGEGHAMRLILSGELIDAEEAADIGLVDEVYNESEFDDSVYELAGRMAEKSPIALTFAKEAIKASSQMRLDNGIEYELQLFVQLFATDDMKEGVEAFLQNRTPEFKGE